MCRRFLGLPKEVVEQIIKDIEVGVVNTLLPNWPALFPWQHAPGAADGAVAGADGLTGKAGQEVLGALEAIGATSVFPKSPAFVIVPRTQGLACEEMVWGFEAAWSKAGVVYNTRADTALKSGRNMWAESLHERRLVVPTLGFFEAHRTETFISAKSGRAIKRQYLFALPDDAPLFLAGIHESGRFSVMTTEPNATVGAVHDRMPVVLRQSEVEDWLHGDWMGLFDRSGVEILGRAVKG
jgi:putative SOS response-associated peptidase YedK